MARTITEALFKGIIPSPTTQLEAAAGWIKETRPDGLPIWRGRDTILNMDWARQREPGRNKWDVGTWVFGGASALFLYAANQGEALFGLLAAITVPASVFYAVMWAKHNYKQWKGGPWTLTASPSALAYSGAASWSVSLDQIASVEADLTTRWELTRHYDAPEPREISEHEWQVFFVLADQSRRVVYTANAARESCTTLAASIRAHIERARAAPIGAASIPSTPAASPSGEGFDL